MGLLMFDEDCVSDLGGEKIPHDSSNQKKLRKQYRKELRDFQGFSFFSSAAEAEEYEKNQCETIDNSGIPVVITSN